MEEKSRDEYGGEREQRANLDVNIKQARAPWSRNIRTLKCALALQRKDIKVK